MSKKEQKYKVIKTEVSIDSKPIIKKEKPNNEKNREKENK